MSEQPWQQGTLTFEAEKTRYDEMREEWSRFHDAHPEVWILFKRFTFDRIERGFAHYGAGAIMERVRWETAAGAGEEEEFKINNNHRAFYARFFMGHYPEHEGFFRVREQTSEDDSPRGVR